MQNKTNHMSITRLRWMTIFEVMIAIILFWTGILVILSMITKNISWVQEIKQRDTAALLAREGLELAYNLRDSNVDRGIVRNCAEFSSGALDNCANYFHQWTGVQTLYTIDLTIDGRYEVNLLASTWSTWLYLHTWLIEQQDGTDILTGFWYSHTSTGGTQSAFRRYILFKPMPLYPAQTWDILYIASYVEYVLWNVTKSVVLESLIGSSR